MTDKCKFALWIRPENKQRVEAIYKNHGFSSQSEFIEAATVFYCDYLSAQSADGYLGAVISSTLGEHLGQLGDRLGRLLFKQTVELSMVMHIIACDTDIDQYTLEKLRGRCVQDVKNTKGMIAFRDILQFQKQL